VEKKQKFSVKNQKIGAKKEQKFGIKIVIKNCCKKGGVIFLR